MDTSSKTDKPLGYDVSVDTAINDTKTRFVVKENNLKVLVDLDAHNVSGHLGGYSDKNSLWVNPYIGLQTDGQFNKVDVQGGVLGVLNNNILLAVN